MAIAQINVVSSGLIYLENLHKAGALSNLKVVREVLKNLHRELAQGDKTLNLNLDSQLEACLTEYETEAKASESLTDTQDGRRILTP